MSNNHGLCQEWILSDESVFLSWEIPVLCLPLLFTVLSSITCFVVENILIKFCSWAGGAASTGLKFKRIQTNQGGKNLFSAGKIWHLGKTGCPNTQQRSRRPIGCTTHGLHYCHIEFQYGMHKQEQSVKHMMFSLLIPERGSLNWSPKINFQWGIISLSSHCLFVRSPLLLGR